ncbi:hypothetical protein SLA2020_140390 [Shorea laevis]
MGVIVRDDNGNVIVALQTKGHECLSPKVVEAGNLWRGLVWTYELGFNRLVVECDSSNVVATMGKGGVRVFLELGMVVQDCVSIMAKFQVCQLQHIYHESNKEIHGLARGALDGEEEREWIEKVLP